MADSDMTLPKLPSMQVQGKRAIVTGAGRGIGLACAAALAEAGAHVVLAARSKGQIEAAAAAINAGGGSAEAAELDVTNLDAIEDVVARTGPFDVLVNNAGLAKHAPLLEIGPDEYDPVMDVNARAVFFMTKAVVKGMVDQGIKGSIIHISSQMGHIGGPKRVVYCGSKSAVEGMTKAMAIELGPHGIRVNTVCPTFIETDLTRAALEDKEFRKWVESKIQLRRVGQPEDIMGPIVFLASDASSLITGTSLMVDGGWTAE
jgi:NAD(P)-dependent dehydrogenase (short-subunit alcohol dehydrogenase family)